MLFKKYNLKQGFTLIELLVVVAIIGLLASVVMASLNTARAKARDAERLSDLHQINLAINEYFNDKGYYPKCGFNGDHFTDGEDFIYDGVSDCLSSILISAGYMSKKLPTDPLYGGVDRSNNWGYDYGYTGDSTGSVYVLRGGFEGTPLKQNSDYPNGTTCVSGIYPTCAWAQTCVYEGYGVGGNCPITQVYSNK